MSNQKFDLRSIIRKEILNALSHRNDATSSYDIERLQRAQSVSAVYGYTSLTDSGFNPNYKKGKRVHGPGGSYGFLGPGFKK
jgi:spore cortex formation protein SpoVR/YcgB (stage V sporulation)